MTYLPAVIARKIVRSDAAIHLCSSLRGVYDAGNPVKSTLYTSSTHPCAAFLYVPVSHLQTIIVFFRHHKPASYLGQPPLPNL